MYPDINHFTSNSILTKINLPKQFNQNQFVSQQNQTHIKVEKSKKKKHTLLK